MADTSSFFWPTRHGGGGNTDYVPIPGPDRLEIAWQALEEIPAATFVGFDRHRRLYLLTLGTGDDDKGILRSFHVDGRLRWSTSRVRPSLTSLGVTANGTVFVADGTELHRFESDGQHRWSRPLPVETSAVVFLDEDPLILGIDGSVHLIDADQGASVCPPWRLPSATMHGGVGHREMPEDLQRLDVFERSMAAIGVDPAYGSRAARRFLGRGVAAKNVPAVTAEGRVLIAAADAQGLGGVLVGLDLIGSGRRQRFEPAFVTGMGGGCDTSPSLSFDGRRAYCMDRDGVVYAFETSSGEIRWTHRLPDAASASLNTAPDGRVYVSIKRDICCLRDHGDRGELEWTTDLGAMAHAAGHRQVLVSSVLCVSERRLYGVVSFGDRHEGQLLLRRHALMIFDRATGALISQTELGHESACTLSMGTDGTLLIPSKPFYQGTARTFGEPRRPFHGLAVLRPAP